MFLFRATFSLSLGPLPFIITAEVREPCLHLRKPGLTLKRTVMLRKFTDVTG